MFINERAEGPVEEINGEYRKDIGYVMPFRQWSNAMIVVPNTGASL